jgi:hypothetical protein
MLDKRFDGDSTLVGRCSGVGGMGAKMRFTNSTLARTCGAGAELAETC